MRSPRLPGADSGGRNSEAAQALKLFKEALVLVCCEYVSSIPKEAKASLGMIAEPLYFPCLRLAAGFVPKAAEKPLEHFKSEMF